MYIPSKKIFEADVSISLPHQYLLYAAGYNQNALTRSSPTLIRLVGSGARCCLNLLEMEGGCCPKGGFVSEVVEASYVRDPRKDEMTLLMNEKARDVNFWLLVICP